MRMLKNKRVQRRCWIPQTHQFKKARIYLVKRLHREDYSVSNLLPQVISLAISLQKVQKHPCSEIVRQITLSHLVVISLLEVGFLDLQQLRPRDPHFLVPIKMGPQMVAEVSSGTLILLQEADYLATLFHQQEEHQRYSANKRVSFQTRRIRSSTKILSQRLGSKIMLIQVTKRELAMVETVHQHLWMLLRSTTQTLSPKSMNN